MEKAIVKIVWDHEKSKLRATPANGSGWVRFPRHLRIEGAMYQVENLKPGRSGSWIATGQIRAINAGQAVSYKAAA